MQLMALGVKHGEEVRVTVEGGDEDDAAAAGDEKVIAIPWADPTYEAYTDISELPKHIFEEIRHFFSVYKDLEGKKTAVNEFEGALGAVKVIEECIDRYKEKYGNANG